MLLKAYCSILGISFVTGCASIISGNQQQVSITVECKGMTIPTYCVASNSEGTWRFNTPATITVNKSPSDLRVSCESSTFGDYSKRASSSTSLTILCNVFAGGILGAAYDHHTNAGLNYPSKIILTTPLCRLM